MKRFKPLQDVAGKSYAYCDPRAKNLLHRRARSFLKELADELRLDPYDISSNKAGVACSGEITLRAPTLHVWVQEACTSPDDLIIVIRGVRGPKDYEGLQNRQMRVSRAGARVIVAACRNAIEQSLAHQAAADPLSSTAG